MKKMLPLGLAFAMLSCNSAQYTPGYSAAIQRSQDVAYEVMR